jgi:hypothetical protein
MEMAADQRYCLECGCRRGDPRLPFMDAVVFMDAARQPAQVEADPPPAQKRERRVPISANASLIAGVGTLLLALGIGVLIGKTGEGSAVNTAATPSVIRVGGGTETASAEAGGGAAAGGEKTGAGGAGKGGASKAKSKAKLATDDSGTTKAAAEVLKPSGDVQLPPPTVQKGGSCEAGAAGCDGGEFTGEFFGE